VSRLSRLGTPPPPRGAGRRLVLAALAGGLVAVPGCSDGPGRNGPGERGSSPSPAAIPTPAARAYRSPADPCAVIPPNLAKRLGMTDPEPRTIGQFERNPEADPTRGQPPVAAYNLQRCSWTVKNPGRGPNGRPNGMTVTIDYEVIEATSELRHPDEVAKAVYASNYQQTRRDGTVVRQAASPVPADDGYYRYVTHKSTGMSSGEAEAGIRLANAVVTVSYSGADLKLDRTLPPGLQLVTTAVPERRLRPTVESLLPAAMDGLRP
jgi:hypothetical protein